MSDSDSIATTTLMDAADFDDYNCDYDFSVKIPKPRVRNSNSWELFVKQNRNIFYDWVENLPPYYIFEKKYIIMQTILDNVAYFIFNGRKTSKNKVKRIIMAQHPFYTFKSPPNCLIEIIIRREPRGIGEIDYNAFNHWYSLSSEIRSAILYHMRFTNMTWFEKIVP